MRNHFKSVAVDIFGPLFGTGGGIRIHTVWILNPSSLPIGLHPHYFGALERDQTSNPLVRSQVLYSIELQVQIGQGGEF